MKDLVFLVRIYCSILEASNKFSIQKQSYNLKFIGASYETPLIRNLSETCLTGFLYVDAIYQNNNPGFLIKWFLICRPFCIYLPY